MMNDILQKLSGVRKQGAGYQARCPSHDDDKASLSIIEKDGKILMHCHAQCSLDDICNGLAIKKKELFLNQKPPSGRKLKKVDQIYDYRDETGRLLFQCVRFEPKGFSQRRPDGDGWIWNLAETRTVLYRLPEILAADKSGPVFICEGEKDADRLVELGLAATCNPLGALKWKSEYSDSLAGFHCVILPDNDEAGRKHSEVVAKSLYGKAKTVTILHLPGLTAKGDVSDWLAAGNPIGDLMALVERAEAYSAASEQNGSSDPELPERYFLTPEGLYYQGENATFICSPLRVVADTCDPDNTSWGRLLEFEDVKGVLHSLVVPMSSLSGDGLEVRSKLMDAGLKIFPSTRSRQLLLQYLLTAKPKDHVLCVNQLGWHDGAFVLPDEVIASNESSAKSVLLQNVDRGANKFGTSGTLEQWNEHVGKYCIGNSRLIFSACTAFAAPLLPIAEEISGGFHIHGNSSTGKTTALLVAGSVWGGDRRKGFLETWRATANGLEAVAELHNHSLLLLDEVSQVNPHEIGEVIYSLSNGFGKSRMNKNTTARRKTEWNLLFFSSGEKTLEQIMQSVNQRIFGGQEARFVNIDADAKADKGIFEDLHGFETGNDLAKHLSSASKKYYGTPIRKFLKMVCENRTDVETVVKELRNYFIAKLQFKGASGEVYRVASRFSLLAAAGILATDFGVVTGWDRKQVVVCIETIFNEWLASRGTIGSFDTAQGKKQVLNFIAQHGSSRFQSVNDTSTRVPNRAGFKRDGYDGQTEYLILPEVFESEVCKGFSAIAVAKELEKTGHLKRGNEKYHLGSKESLPDLGRKRVYVIVFEGAEEAEEARNEVMNF